MDSKYYYGPTIHETADALILRDAPHENTTELWHYRLGHVNQTDLRRMQSVAHGVLIAPEHKLSLSFCECCVLSNSKQKPLGTPNYNAMIEKNIIQESYTAYFSRSVKIPVGTLAINLNSSEDDT